MTTMHIITVTHKDPEKILCVGLTVSKKSGVKEVFFTNFL